jgi:hypothetical protein
MYYRVAIQGDPSAPWQWKSTVLSSLDTLFQFLRLYQALPQDRLRVFSSSSRGEMNGQLARENQGLMSKSVMAAQFLQERMIGSPQGISGASGSGIQGSKRKVSTSVSREQSLNESSGGAPVLDESGLSVQEKRRGELERGVGGDNDVPYRFTLPTSLPQVLAWIKLLTKVQKGELQP